ncbi:MAG: pantetheine-phosphate adenylyltransferase [bacterium]|nr:pantetheine-phosphate adenylyltransferase [bacterium]
MRTALYPGSFDPVTNGHIDIIRRAASIFDRLIVAVAVNKSKEAMFSPDERLEMLREAVSDIAGIEVASFDGLLVKYARDNGVTAIVKGLRAISDFEFELQMASTNHKLDPGIETLFMMTSNEYSFLSSSMVKEIAGYGASVSCMVPPHVERRLRERLGMN